MQKLLNTETAGNSARFPAVYQVVRRNDAVIRIVFFGIFILGLAGTGLELLLLNHRETLLQVIPLVLIPLILVVTAWHLVFNGRASLVALRATAAALLVAGVLGIALHYRGNVSFQKEIDPTIEGFALFSKAIHATAPPALAPASMIWFGLLGLACTYLPGKRRESL
jgi:hypothetical protein